METVPSMDEWPVENLLHMLQFLSGADSCRFAQTARRNYFLVHHYRRLRGAELVLSTSNLTTGDRTQELQPKEVYSKGIEQMQKPPNFCLGFNTRGSPLPDHLPSLVPDNCVILGAVSSEIQTSLGGVLEHESNSSIMMGSLDAIPITFLLNREEQTGEANITETLDGIFGRAKAKESSKSKTEDEDDDWKVFIVYAAGGLATNVEPVVSRLQSRYPAATIVGGICTTAYVSLPFEKKAKEELMEMPDHSLSHLSWSLGGPRFDAEKMTKEDLVEKVYGVMQTKTYRLHQLDDNGGVLGMGLKGDVPVRSMVSRGLKSLTLKGPAQPRTPFYIQETQFYRPGDEGFIFSGEDAPSYHLVTCVRDENTGKRFSAQQLMSEFGDPFFIGIRRPGDEDGFELSMAANDISQTLNAFLFMAGNADESERALSNANIDLFTLDSEASLLDINTSVSRLKAQVGDETVLGAVMYSCSARGPKAGSIFSHDMGDVKAFSEVFTGVPCVGFYAGGEVGPLTRTGRNDVFAQGNSALQGFTAVFALFIVPPVKLRNVDLDDSRANVEAFCQEKLKQSRPSSTAS